MTAGGDGSRTSESVTQASKWKSCTQHLSKHKWSQFPICTFHRFIIAWRELPASVYRWICYFHPNYGQLWQRACQQINHTVLFANWWANHRSVWPGHRSALPEMFPSTSSNHLQLVREYPVSPSQPVLARWPLTNLKACVIWALFILF